MKKLSALTHPFSLNSRASKQKGFTLIELLIVVSILAVLAVIGLVTFTNAQRSTRNSKRSSDLRDIQNAVELCYNDRAAYPAGTYATLLTNATCPLAAFLPQGLPSEPQVAAGRPQYTYAVVGTGYQLCAVVTGASTNYEGAPGTANVPQPNNGALYCLYNQQ